MNKTFDLLNQYLADLAILNTKLHNLHWNVTGKNFKPVHVYFEELYDDLFAKFDEVAERIKMLEGYPLARVADYLKVSKIDELDSVDITTGEAFKLVYTDYQYLAKLATDIRNYADENGDFGTVMLLEDHVSAYAKQLYFMRQSLK